MSKPTYDSPASSNALNHGRALHRNLRRQPGRVDLGVEQECAKELWVELVRACACPVEETLMLALRKLDTLRGMIEARNTRRPLMGVAELRRGLDAIEKFIDETPLAPAGSNIPPCAAHDLPTSGLLFRLLQRRPMVRSVNTPRPVANPTIAKQTKLGGNVRIITRAISRKVRSARSARISTTRPHGKAA